MPPPLNEDLASELSEITTSLEAMYGAGEECYEDGIWFEPKNALFAEDEGMIDLKTIIFKSINFLKDNGMLFLEHAPDQAKKVIREAKKVGFKKIEQINDYNGLTRVSILG